MKQKAVRPACVEDEHLLFLDFLQGTGATNMFGAWAYLHRYKRVPKKDAHLIVQYWVESYNERDHPAAGTGGSC